MATRKELMATLRGIWNIIDICMFEHNNMLIRLQDYAPPDILLTDEDEEMILNVMRCLYFTVEKREDNFIVISW